MPIQGFQGPLQAHQGMAIFESTYSLDNMQAGAGMMEAVYSQPTSPADTKGPQSCLWRKLQLEVGAMDEI